MMAKNVYHAYRVLRPEQLDELNPQIMKIKGTFCHRGEYLPMNLEESTVCAGEYTIEAEAWNPGDCSCTVDIQLDIDTKGIRSLFEGPCRITGTDSVLGVALLWNVIRGTTGVNNCQVMPVDISLDMADSGIISCKDSVSFPEDYLAGGLSLSCILYLKKPSSVSEAGIATCQGTRLGSLVEPMRIWIDGDGSTFPLIIVEEDGKPLWWVETDRSGDTEYLVDSFDSDFVAVFINRKHPDYPFLCAEKGARGYKFGDAINPRSALFLEIIASAWEELFRQIYDKVKGEQESEGSIASAMKYMIRTFNLDVETDARRHETIRRMVADAVNMEGGKKSSDMEERNELETGG